MDLGPLRVLVVNAGSETLKLNVVEDGDSREVDSLDQDVDAVAHRVVHGGARFRDPILVDDEVRKEIEALAPLAPLHNPGAVRGIDEALQALPDLPHVAVFDTGFHATIPHAAATYAIPREWREWGIRRYGFHGLSVQWAAERVPVPRLVVCHLGGGCSITAVRDGHSVDTTMGFSPLEGVPMTTRAGSFDPGAMIYLLRARGLGVDELDRALNFESGISALAGVRGMQAAEVAGTAEAELAIAVFANRVAGAAAAMAVACGGLDALVFTAGIGEGSARVRSEVCARLAFVSVELDEEANARGEGDRAISSGAVAVHVVHAREELVAARAVEVLLAQSR
jgi:acetate kinase